MSKITKHLRIACTMWIPLAVLAFTLMATTWPRPRTARLDRMVAARLTDIPSHNRVYRASLELTSGSVWTLRLRSASDIPVPNAGVSMEAWMPEQERVAHAAPAAIQYAGAGTYRVSPLTFDRSGWWNIKVQVSATGGTDSLAFNVILR
jgi:hypothetical protein